VRAAWRSALTGLRSRRRRALAGGVGIALAAAMLSASVVISYGLGTGFPRAVRAAGLPDIIARFHNVGERRVAARIRALPDLARFALRLEITDGEIAFHDRRTGAIVEILDRPGADEGYAVVAGANLALRGPEVLVERAFADAWGIHVGSRVRIGDGFLPPLRVAGLVEGPDDVGYPLAKARIYLSRPALDALFHAPERFPQVDLAEIWLRNPAYVNEVLAQARASVFGLKDIQFATRSGIKILRDQAAGIVIDLLVALSIIALLTAGVLLAASARAEVQRRLRAFGVRRAIGESRRQLVRAQLLEGLLVSLPAGSLGAVGGVLATHGADSRLLELLNEPAPGWSLWWPLGLAWLGAVGLPAAGVAWPAWRATGGPAATLLRGGDLAPRGRRGWLRTGGQQTRIGGGQPTGLGRRLTGLGRRLTGLGGGLAGLGVRLVGARRGRWLASVVTLALSAAFVLLMLALASELSALESDPSALGKRYQLTASLPPPSVSLATLRRVPGVAALAPRYEVGAADSFALGETIDTIAYPGDHTVFEAPALVSGRRLRGPDEAEVGAGLANALGLTEGSVLALALPSGVELRVRVVGVVSSLDHEGRVAYIRAGTLLRADPGARSSGSLAIVLTPGADQHAVSAALSRLGAPPTPTTGVTTSSGPLIAVLRTILRAVAVIDGLVCLYALIQACALTVFERRRTVAVLRACGAGPGAVRRLLLGAVAALVVPAAAAGVLLERDLLGPVLSRLAENYAVLDLAAGGAAVAALLAGLSLAGLVAVLWVARAAARDPVVEGLGA
jgi:ABC-type antimicrobial peptide transport system permease subunit